jgi:hypothetical protein
MSKLYDVVGVSAVRKGAPLKFRLANGKPARRARILERNGHDDIFLVQLDRAMGKDEAIAAFKERHDQYADIDAAKRKVEVKVVVPKAKPAAKAVKATVKASGQISPAALKAVNKVMSKVA